MLEILDLCNFCFKITSGKFDPTVRPLLNLWKRHLAEAKIPSDHMKYYLSISGDEEIEAVKGVRNNNTHRMKCQRLVGQTFISVMGYSTRTTSIQLSI